MLASQKLAVAAHMHVLLGRKTGRVTDPEWMASNVEYGLEIVRATPMSLVTLAACAEFRRARRRVIVPETPAGSGPESGDSS